MMVKKRKVGEFLVKMFKRKKDYRIAIYKKGKLLAEIFCDSKRYALQDFDVLVGMAMEKRCFG